MGKLTLMKQAKNAIFAGTLLMFAACRTTGGGGGSELAGDRVSTCDELSKKAAGLAGSNSHGGNVPSYFSVLKKTELLALKAAAAATAAARVATGSGDSSAATHYRQIYKNLEQCNYVGPETVPTQGLDSYSRQTLFDTVYSISQVSRLCDLLRYVQNAPSGELNQGSCNLEIMVNTCKVLPNGIKAAAQVFYNDQNIQIATDGVLLSAMKDAFMGCVKYAAQKQLIQEMKSLARVVGTSEFLQQNIRDAAEDSLGKPKLAGIQKQIATAACVGASMVIGNAISQKREVDFENACGFKFDKTRLASCFRSSGDICMILSQSGNIDVANFMPDTASKGAIFLQDVSSAVVSGACSLGANASKAACNAISAAAFQIKQALITGNNDWAHCVGSDQLGTCIGTKYAEVFGGAMSRAALDAPVAQALGSSDNRYRKCCWCYRDYYKRYWLYPNEFFRRDNAVFVTGEGDGGALCQERSDYPRSELPEKVDGYPAYFVNRECGEVYVKGESCPTIGWNEVLAGFPAKPKAAKSFQFWQKGAWHDASVP